MQGWLAENYLGVCGREGGVDLQQQQPSCSQIWSSAGHLGQKMQHAQVQASLADYATRNSTHLRQTMAMKMQMCDRVQLSGNLTLLVPLWGRWGWRTRRRSRRRCTCQPGLRWAGRSRLCARSSGPRSEPAIASIDLVNDPCCVLLREGAMQGAPGLQACTPSS